MHRTKSEHNSIEGDKIETVVDRVFGGEIESHVTCLSCNETSKMTEEFFDLSLPISVPKKVNYGGHERYSRKNRWVKKQGRNQKQKQKWKKQEKTQQQKGNSNVCKESGGDGMGRRGAVRVDGVDGCGGIRNRNRKINSDEEATVQR